MTNAEIAASYSDKVLAGIIRQLTRTGQWRERLAAAKHELQRREIQNQIQDKESIL